MGANQRNRKLIQSERDPTAKCKEKKAGGRGDERESKPLRVMGMGPASGWDVNESFAG